MASQVEKTTLTKPHPNHLHVLLEGIRKTKSLTLSELPLSPSDTILCSSPKIGATWLKSLAFSIVTRTRIDVSFKHHPILSVSHDLIPFIEVDIANNHKPRDPNLSLLSTHLPFPGLPDPVLDSGCKIVYIYRNPKDVFVSYWQFTRKFAKQGELESMLLEKVFDEFCSNDGAGICGNYWDHVLGYWKASLDYPGRFMLFKYEDMMEEVVPCVKRLAEFMGYGFSEEEEGSGVVENIVKMCSFGNLSKLEVNKTGRHREIISNSTFFRKAKVGDCSNYLTPEMGNEIGQITFRSLLILVWCCEKTSSYRFLVL